MSATKTQQARKLDALMEQASHDLVARNYFAALRGCQQALEIAMSQQAYERMARILLPLQEARRQIRDLAFDAGEVSVVDAELPTKERLRPGLYLVQPPRVGVDGRALRELAESEGIPVVIVVRELQSRDGLWPVVAVGPVTLRCKVRPPEGTPAEAPVSIAPSGKGRKPGGDPTLKLRLPPVLPPREWFIAANEALGDVAIAEVPDSNHPAVRVEAFYARLLAHPDHEKLHQRLREACEEAARNPTSVPRHRPHKDLDEEDEITD